MAMATFRIWRGSTEGGEFVDYQTEVSEGMVVLDALHKIQAEQAPDLAIRWNCKAGKCGSCSGETDCTHNVVSNEIRSLYGSISSTNLRWRNDGTGHRALLLPVGSAEGAAWLILQMPINIDGGSPSPSTFLARSWQSFCTNDWIQRKYDLLSC